VRELISDRWTAEVDSVEEGILRMAVRPAVQLQALSLPMTWQLQQLAAVLQQLHARHLTRLAVGAKLLPRRCLLAAGRPPPSGLLAARLR
jgi:hypothetical protein